MSDIYISGHSDHTDELTFVPDGKVAYMYAKAGFMLPVQTETVLLSGGAVEPRDTFDFHRPIPNYAVTPLSSCERAAQTAYEASPCVIDILTVEEPTLLCTGGCSKETGHQCDGLFGERTASHRAIHLSICRGDAWEEPTESDIQRRREVDAFLELGLDDRATAWRDICENVPDRRDRFLAYDEVIAFIAVLCVWDYARSRNSSFAVSRYLDVLDEESFRLISEYAETGEDACCDELWDRYALESQAVEEFLAGMENGTAAGTWDGLHQESRDDLLALQSSSVGAKVREWLGSLGEASWRRSVMKADWMQAEGEPVVIFGDEFYAILGSSEEEPVWPGCRQEPWCWVVYSGDDRQLVRLGTSTTPRRRQVRNAEGRLSYMA